MLSGIRDSGKRTQEATGAVREPEKGNGRFDLISPYALWRLAKWYELGAEKYADRNWEKGVKASRCFSSAIRHLMKWMMGWKDEDHLAAAAWNIFAIMHFEEVMTDMIDVPSRKEV